MNYRMTANLIGKILLIVAVLMLIPLFIGVGLKEYDSALAFTYTFIMIAGLGAAGFFIKPKRKNITAKESIVVVGFSWLLLSVLGAFPFFFTKAIPNFFDCIFETASGFTTTGASILVDIETLSKSLLFWRSFTHWIGGMGVLVLILAVLPSEGGSSFHLMKMESPGPQVGKLVSKVRLTAQILYVIYFVMTAIECIFLLAGGMDFYNSVIIAMGTAGTGGFTANNGSIGAFNNLYFEIVVTVFMVLFSINFNCYYLLLLRRFKEIWKSEELKFYVVYLVCATLIIALNILSLYENFGQALRYASFQVASISSTTGFATADYNNWPMLSKCLLLVIMFIGACAGSTGGGFKVSRIILLIKSAIASATRVISPRSVVLVKIDKKPIPDDQMESVQGYMVIYFVIFLFAVAIISMDNFDFATTFSSVLTCLSNVGPGLNMVGPMGNFSEFSGFSKLIFSLLMLLGRLEIFPILMLFSPNTWSHK